MGYSCTAKASFVLEEIRKVFDSRTTKKVGSNSIINNYGVDIGFYEIGRENQDGAITGSVFKFVSADGRCRKAGSFKIAANGRIERFPSLTSVTKNQCEFKAMQRYKEIYGEG